MDYLLIHKVRLEYSPAFSGFFYCRGARFRYIQQYGEYLVCLEMRSWQGMPVGRKKNNHNGLENMVPSTQMPFCLEMDAGLAGPGPRRDR
jgi:hypothetical protein